MKTKVSGGNTTTYNWDFESNLIGIDFPGTSNDDTHEYDGAGRRMRSKFNGASNWTNYIWDETTETLLAEYTLISSTYLIKSENTWGLGLISTTERERSGTSTSMETAIRLPCEYQRNDNRHIRLWGRRCSGCK